MWPQKSTEILLQFCTGPFPPTRHFPFGISFAIHNVGQRSFLPSLSFSSSLHSICWNGSLWCRSCPNDFGIFRDMREKPWCLWIQGGKKIKIQFCKNQWFSVWCNKFYSTKREMRYFLFKLMQNNVTWQDEAFLFSFYKNLNVSDQNHLKKIHPTTIQMKDTHSHKNRSRQRNWRIRHNKIIWCNLL